MSVTNLLNEKHIINAIVTIGSKKLSIVSLRLEQEYGKHHTFEIKLDYDINGQAFMSEPSRQIELIGSIITIQLQQGNDSKNSYLFKGVVTHIQMTGKDGKHGYIVLKGASPTCMLDRGKRMEVYSDKPLRSVFKHVIDGVYNDYLTMVNDPRYENKIDFLMQYNETDWEFMKRLAYLYGENLFYSGTELLFGQYREWEPVKLTYDKEISDLVFGSRMLPNQFTAYQYVAEQDALLEKAAPDKIENSNPYLNIAAEQALPLTSEKPATNVNPAPVSSTSELDELVKKTKTRTAAGTVYVEGIAKTHQAVIGRLITVRMPEGISKLKELGTYRVIKSVHTIDAKHHYSLSFTAVPASLEIMPVEKPPMPIADSVLGKVTSNEDPKGQGRVQVDFSFAGQYSKIWMRVMTPNGGGSEQVKSNRGMVFIPEKGDQVMVGFELGDPNRPYVMGAMFHGRNGAGGGMDNAVKSIITRSGVKIIFNDTEGSAHIEDPSGNTWDMDGQGNIRVYAPENITFSAKNISMNASENIVGYAGEEINLNADNNLNFIAGEDSQVSANNIYSQATTDSLHTAKQIKIAAEKTRIDSSKENMVLASKGEVDVQSAKRVKLF